jgi:hypothetical protein
MRELLMLRPIALSPIATLERNLAAKDDYSVRCKMYDEDTDNSNDSRDLDLTKDLYDQYGRDDAARETDSDRSEVDQAWDDAAEDGSN